MGPRGKALQVIQDRNTVVGLHSCEYRLPVELEQVSLYVVVRFITVGYQDPVVVLYDVLVYVIDRLVVDVELQGVLFVAAKLAPVGEDIALVVQLDGERLKEIPKRDPCRVPVYGGPILRLKVDPAALYLECWARKVELVSEYADQYGGVLVLPSQGSGPRGRPHHGRRGDCKIVRRDAHYGRDRRQHCGGYQHVFALGLAPLRGVRVAPGLPLLPGLLAHVRLRGAGP
ncbi:hypothetical protein CENSYa_1288 [Cenarchaeum symbiosum A]|uniref:Uncharacterized protein n=1 Tax=Cenarchaeum symbiosum (strain A) TaxID=414004 RepID=A0RX44_CENSY|nr:hypothetical protein CENSYa_1288 [Cenarchaeum symbiosum A]